MTDDAWADRSLPRGVCAAHGIRQRFIKVPAPWQNEWERLNRTVQTDRHCCRVAPKAVSSHRRNVEAVHAVGAGSCIINL
jgi:hypothetical protein